MCASILVIILMTQCGRRFYDRILVFVLRCDMCATRVTNSMTIYGQCFEHHHFTCEHAHIVNTAQRCMYVVVRLACVCVCRIAVRSALYAYACWTWWNSMESRVAAGSRAVKINFDETSLQLFQDGTKGQVFNKNAVQRVCLGARRQAVTYISFMCDSIDAFR